MKEKVTCAERINTALQIRGMKQIELAEKSNLSRSHISYYCSGKVVPKQEATYQLAKALDVNEAWLMGYDVPMERIPDSERSLPEKGKDLFRLIAKLDDDDKANLQNYIENVLLAQKKYDKKTKAI